MDREEKRMREMRAKGKSNKMKNRQEKWTRKKQINEFWLNMKFERIVRKGYRERDETRKWRNKG